MATVTRYPAAFSSSPGSTWVDGSNIFADDGAYATTAGSRNSNWDIVGAAFGFSIPAESIINNVTTEAKYKLSTAASAWTGTLQAQYNGTLKGTAATSTSEPTVDTVWTKSTLNGAWTGEELNSDQTQVLFRVRRTSNTACIYSLDYLSLTVDYTPPVQHALTIHYQYTDTSTSASAYTAQVTEGKPYSVPSPTVAGYTPDTASVSGTMGTGDVTVTVIYSLNPCQLTLTPSLTKIGTSGTSSVSVSSNIDVIAFEARATLDGQPYGRGIGINIISDDLTVEGSGVHTFAAPTNSWSFDVAYSEINADGTYRISVYAQNADNVWSL